MAAPLPNIDVYHRERSKLIDAFAQIEMALVRGIAKKSDGGRSGTLGTRIKAFRDAYPQLSVAAAQCLDDVANLNELRTDIVHGVLSLTDECGRRYAVFSNARDASKDLQSARRMELAAIKRTIEKLVNCATTIENIAKR